jgi:PBP1b-binding outer membrane lipoprotein LpoB
MNRIATTLALIGFAFFGGGCADQTAPGTKATPATGAAATASQDKFQPTLDSLKQYECPDCEVRHLGALGTAGRADGWRLVCARHV